MSSNTMNDASKSLDVPAIEVPRGKLILYMVILYLLFVSDYWARVGINTLLPLIKTDLSLSDTQVGLLSSVVLFGMMAFVMPVAYLADKWSKRGTICALGFTWSLGSILCGAFPMLGTLIAGRFMVGVGNSGFAPASVSTFTNWFPRKRWGTIISLYNTAITVGVSGGMFVTGILVMYFDWQTVFLLLGIPGILLSFAILGIPKEKKLQESTENKVTLKETFKKLFQTKSLLSASLASTFFFYGLNAFYVFGVIYFTREMNMSITEAGSYMGITGLVGVAFGPLGGVILDRLTKYKLIFRGLTPVLFLALTVLTFASGYALKNFPLILAGFLFAKMVPVCYHVITQEVVPSNFRASSYGAMVLFLQLGGSIGSLATGYFSDLYGIKWAMVLSCAGFVASAVCFLLVTYYYPRDLQKVEALNS